MATQAPPIEIALTSREIFTTLSFFKLGIFGSITFPILVPPNGMATFSFPVPRGYVLILDLLAPYATVDNVLDVTVYVDNKVLLWDGQFNNNTYPPGGILFYDRGILPTVLNELSVIIYNNSSQTVYFFMRIEFGLVSTYIYGNLLKNYYSVIEQVIGS
ncbi:MAG: hypothetical protein L7H04_01185 [Vulcanisaeta sp.]|nr:hypothetical protein [Vulcanisaeta sp.]